MCYILCMCVCVGASDTTTASDDPFLGGSQGGAGMPPLGYAERSAPDGSPGPTGFGAAPQVCTTFGTWHSPGTRGSGQRPENFFLGGFLLFLADFAIFS
jgi:hypothetical protein